MKTKLFIGALAASLAIVGISAALPSQTRPQVANAAYLDKYDGDCTGNETAGRCSDKCPLPTAEGAYHKIGIDEHGMLICGFTYYSPCPYAEGYSAKSDMCDKLKQEQVLNPVETKPQEGK